MYRAGLYNIHAVHAFPCVHKANFKCVPVAQQIERSPPKCEGFSRRECIKNRIMRL